MANVSQIQDDCMDDSDEGFDQGDGSVGTPEDDASLPPLERLKKYALSLNAFDRQMVVRLVQEMFKTSPADVLTAELPEIMRTLVGIGDASMLVADLLEQIPYVALQALECSSRVSALKNVGSEYLTPLVVRNLGCNDAAVNRAARDALIQLIEQGYINKQQAEIQVCPSILALSKVETSLDVNTGAISLMSKLASLLGRDITERVFLKRFIELCASPLFYIRKICAAHLGEFATVVGKDTFKRSLLPCYITFCTDDVWGVRKACAEVVMFLSCACDPIARRTLLTPVFLKLLQDECRWVKMSAFQALGPFITTFAVPTLTNVGYNKGGDLVLLNDEGTEFTINLSRTLSMSERFSIMNEEKKNIDLFLDDEDEDDERGGKNDCNIAGLLKIQETEEKPDPNDASVDEKCDTADVKVENDLSGMMDKILLIVNNEEVEKVGGESACLKTKGDEEAVGATTKNSTDNINVESDGQDEKVNVNNTGCDTIEEDLHLFNSHNYWYVSPEMPLDPFLVAGGDSTTALNATSDIAAHLEDLYSAINLSNNLDSTKPNPNDSTISFDEVYNVCDISGLSSPRAALSDQKVVPEQLVYHYISMTDPTLLNTDNEMTYHCAYFLPAVASTLGSNNWHLLKDTVDSLAGDMQYRVRKTVASSLYELAVILGPKITSENLEPLFDGFIKDLDEVRIGILQHLASFLELISSPKRSSYLPRLGEFLQTDNESNWRFREELAKQLLNALPLINPIETAKHVWTIAIELLADKVAAVRQAAMTLITDIVKHTSSVAGLTPCLLVQLAENFAHSKKWKRRQSFCLLCSELLKKHSLPAEQFASEIMPHLLDLSWDPVANVRLVVARCISQHILKSDYFADPSNEQFDSFETVLRRLQADKDVDVRQCAEL